MTAMLEVDGIHTAYGSSRVLFGISLDINQGECVCLLGRNGVGKTTTMRSIMGLTPPSQGSVRFKGKDVTGQSPYRLARHGIGYVPEDRRIFAELTVWENLDVAARSANRAGRWTVDTVVQLFPKLGELRRPRRIPWSRWRACRSFSRRSPAVATAWAACCRAASSRC